MSSYMGDSEVSLATLPSLNSAGGILCVWSEKSFMLERKVMGNGFIMLAGMWLKEAQRVHIVNIYFRLVISKVKECYRTMLSS